MQELRAEDVYTGNGRKNSKRNWKKQDKIRPAKVEESFCGATLFVSQ